MTQYSQDITNRYKRRWRIGHLARLPSEVTSSIPWLSLANIEGAELETLIDHKHIRSKLGTLLAQ